ncbi:hypothetical protein BT96DRAFT_984682 [Gymnopus androsaceus JB14]|uniref:PWWP domain-containing protein n=1 Tax=Gymnopus androsaceus JB14 TaxID=1447944 RepID=A0A6A4IMF8_9AGAR|nr:hypothetical protein BT96DRAFT_984682 [Gymnopus androsaceus JB14]
MEPEIPGRAHPGAKLKNHASKDVLFGETGLKKGSSPVKYGSRAKTGAYSRHSESMSPSARPQSSKAIRIETSNASPRTPSKKRPFTTSNDDSDVEISELSPLSPLTPLTPFKSGSGSGVSPTRRSAPKADWRVPKRGDLVWVRLSETGEVFEPELDDEGDFIWWPAKVTEGGKNLTVRPYGTIGASPTVRIRPSQHNILSFTDSLSGQPRFKSQSFQNSTVLLGSPRKKVKHDHHIINWSEAVSEILQDDGRPPIELVARSAQSPNSRKRNGKRNTSVMGKGKTGSDDELQDELESESDWDPPEPDEMLAIPGELVLARERADSKIHWPAKVLGFITPTKPKGKARPKEPKYNVVFLDNTEKSVPREWFYACDEPEFGTCEMGKFESQHVDIDNPDEDADAPQNTQTVDIPRSPSPVPLSSLSSDFGDLPIRVQLGYMKPVLLAILNAQYPPAKARHDSFMKGGKARTGLGASAGLRGTIPPRDIEKLQKHLCDWCLRDEVRATNDSEDDAVAMEVEAEARLPLEHIDNASSTSIVDSGTVPVTSHSAKENIHPDDEGKSVLSKPALADSSLPPSPRPTLPPSSSMISLASEDGANPFSSQTENANNEVPTDGTPLKLERQKGCEAYENLSGLEKISYCATVLLPEAVFQLLLWRNGHRTCVELLSDVEEAELHTKAEALAQETDWVFDVVRLRETKVQHLKKQAGKKNDTSGSRSGRQSSRPKRNSARY